MKKPAVVTGNYRTKTSWVSPRVIARGIIQKLLLDLGKRKDFSDDLAKLSDTVKAELICDWLDIAEKEIVEGPTGYVKGEKNGTD